MTECTSCGREYPSTLEAALCGDIDAYEFEDRRNGSIYRSID
ncbi:hypothetical protein [Microbacterium pumilum]